MSPVEANSVLLTFRFFGIMQKFIISVKDKHTGRDAIAPYIVNSLYGLGLYSERISPLGLVVIVDSIQEESHFVEPDKSSQDGDEK